VTTLIDGQYEFVNAAGQSIIIGKGTSIRVATVAGLLGKPERKVNDVSPSGRHGILFAGDDFMGMRSLIFQIASYPEADPTEVEILLEEFETVFDGPGYVSIKRQGKVQRRAYGRFRLTEYEANWDVHMGYAAGAAQMDCEDPRLYSEDLEIMSATLSTSQGGWTPNRIYPFGYGGAVNTSDITCENMGNIEAPVLMRIYGPVINPQVVHIEQGRTLSFDLELDAADILEIDTGERTLVENGIINRRHALTPSSIWWNLQVGMNTIRYLADSGDGSHLEIDCRSAWKTG
jgi:hypothetical protein